MKVLCHWFFWLSPLQKQKCVLELEQLDCHIVVQSMIQYWTTFGACFSYLILTVFFILWRYEEEIKIEQFLKPGMAGKQTSYFYMLSSFLFMLLAELLNLTRSLREPGGPCTKSMEVLESRMERVKTFLVVLRAAPPPPTPPRFLSYGMGETNWSMNTWITPHQDNSPACGYWSWWMILPVDIGLVGSKAVGESRVPVSRPKASSPGRKKLMLDTRKY